MNYNRKSRRQIAKSLGMLANQDRIAEEEIGQINRFQKRSERIRRAQEAGRQIHLQFVQLIEENQKESQEELDTRILNNKIDWYMNVYTGNKGKGLSRKDAEKRAKEELQEFKKYRELRDRIRDDEKALRNQLKAEGKTKGEIKSILRKIRQEMKAEGTYYKRNKV